MKLVLIVIFLLSCFSCKDKRVILNNTNLFIENADWNFGNVQSDTIVEHTFVIENPTKQVCVINNIITSCGCTNYDLSQDTIQSGEKVYLEVRLNLKGLTGYITRDVSIFASLDEKPCVITLSAYIPLSETVIKREFRTLLSKKIRANSSFLYVGNVFNNQKITGDLLIVNTSDTPLILDYALIPKRKYIQIIGPDTLFPFRPEKVIAIYDGTQTGKYCGTDSTKIQINDTEQNCLINIDATIVPIPYMKSEKNPRIFIPSKIVSFDNKNIGKIRIKNIGNADLRIIDVNCSRNIHISMEDSLIAPNSAGYIKIMSRNRLRKDEIIEVLTNDVFMPIIILELKNQM
jgi:hypothetical protein